MSGSHSMSSETGPFLSASVGPRRQRVILEPNTELAHFCIETHLGRGSLGDVYLAEDSASHRKVAIKVVDVGPCSPRFLAGQLRREKAVYDRIHDHRHVLKVYDIHPVSWGGTELFVLSMAYADGGTFRDWLEACRDDREARRTKGLAYFKQMCLGLAACHDVGIAHLDIKPENCLFVGELLKVADFNVSAFVCHLTLSCTSLSGIDAEKVALGTPAYMSPEHFNAPHPDDLDERADIYSLGVTLYEILHPQCRTPYGGDPWRLRELHLSAPIPELPEATELQERVVTRCLQKDREDRYQTVAELVDDLEGRAPQLPDTVDTEAVIRGDVEAMRQQIHENIDHARLAEARRLCEEVLERCPEHEEARDILADLQNRYQQVEQLYSEIEQGLDGRPLAELCALLTEAVTTYPEHPAGRTVQLRLHEKARHYRERMEEGIAAARRRDWEGAMSWFEKAKELNVGQPGAENPVYFATKVLEQIQQVRQWIDEALAAGNRARALALARCIDEYLDRLRESLPNVDGDQAA